MKNINDFNEIQNKVVVITGCAGNLGAEYARFLLESGAKVFGIDLAEESRIFNLKSKYENNFYFFKGDITSKISMLKALNECLEYFKKIDVLINNAAIDSPPNSKNNENCKFENFREDTWDKVMEVNLKGPFICSQVFGTEMSINSGGSIINISSIYGILSPDQSLYEYIRDEGVDFFKPISYSVSKSGIINMTRYLAVYWAKKNVRVNTLTIAGVENNQDPRFISNYTNRIPVGKMASKEDYNGAILFLASSASSYMTGSNLVIDGGWSSI
jgi:NAD(P)-dependent dehydrogenase (short-subunit alcohol dehydrogenase family)